MTVLDDDEDKTLVMTMRKNYYADSSASFTVNMDGIFINFFILVSF